MSEASTQEEAARARLAKIKARAQRELSRAASAAVIEEQQEKRRLLKARVRAETNALIGKDVTERVREIPEIDENEVRSLSMLFNQHLKQFDRDSRNFFQLFKSMDIDGSKRIGFGELEHMVRSKLMIPEKKIDAQKLLGLWKRLDENESGFIDAGELSRFLRIGKLKEPTPAQKARARLQAERERKMAMVRKESDKLLEKDVAARVGEVQPASEEDIVRFGKLFSNKLAEIRPRDKDSVNSYTLFKNMDADGSGRVKFEEFERMMRVGLKLDEKALPRDNIWSLWRSIDDNENGFICVGEFGRFMKVAAGKEASRMAKEHPSSRMLEVKQRMQENEAYEGLKREEQWARKTATDALAHAKHMEAEAARLERLLGKVAEKTLVPERRSFSSADLMKVGDESMQLAVTERKQALRMLQNEVRKGGGRNRVKSPGAASLPMLLPTFAREEGHL